MAKIGYREVSNQDGEAFRVELGAKNYFETSAKEGDSVEQVFKELTLEILRTAGKI